MIISENMQHTFLIYFDAVLEGTNPCSCGLLIDSPMKFYYLNKEEMLPETLVSLYYRSLQQQFVCWHMVVRLTNTSGLVKALRFYVWNILFKESYICLEIST
ncbi:unnamed protein product [Arabidopsis halleri]